MNLLPEPWADLGWAYYIAHYGKKGNLPLIVDLTKEIKDRVIKRAVREYHG